MLAALDHPVSLDRTLRRIEYAVICGYLACPIIKLRIDRIGPFGSCQCPRIIRLDIFPVLAAQISIGEIGESHPDRILAGYLEHSRSIFRTIGIIVYDERAIACILAEDECREVIRGESDIWPAIQFLDHC